MNIVADTNVLLRAVVGDDAKQSQIAIETLEQAEIGVASENGKNRTLSF